MPTLLHESTETYRGSGMIYRWNFIFICNEVIIYHHSSHFSCWHFWWKNLFPFYLRPNLVLFLFDIGREYIQTRRNGKMLSVHFVNLINDRIFGKKRTLFMSTLRNFVQVIIQGIIFLSWIPFTSQSTVDIINSAIHLPFPSYIH